MDKQQLLKTLKTQGILHPDVLNAIKHIPREKFIQAAYQKQAYDNLPLPLELGQTISQPYIVAYMTEYLMPLAGKKILEIGTGSGYQAAVLATLGARVYSIERLETLAKHAEENLNKLGIKNIDIRIANGYDGWLEHAPYDAIIVTASAQSNPPSPLLEQLAVGGKMIIPIQNEHTFEEYLYLINKISSNNFRYQQLIPVRFVPFVNM